MYTLFVFFTPQVCSGFCLPGLRSRCIAMAFMYDANGINTNTVFIRFKLRVSRNVSSCHHQPGDLGKKRSNLLPDSGYMKYLLALGSKNTSAVLNQKDIRGVGISCQPELQQAIKNSLQGGPRERSQQANSDAMWCLRSFSDFG